AQVVPGAPGGDPRGSRPGRGGLAEPPGRREDEPAASGRARVPEPRADDLYRRADDPRGPRPAGDGQRWTDAPGSRRRADDGGDPRRADDGRDPRRADDG